MVRAMLVSGSYQKSDMFYPSNTSSIYDLTAQTFADYASPCPQETALNGVPQLKARVNL
jgi:hypothetical protein